MGEGELEKVMEYVSGNAEENAEESTPNQNLLMKLIRKNLNKAPKDDTALNVLITETRNGYSNNIKPMPVFSLQLSLTG